jgi:hypothetical protein
MVGNIVSIVGIVMAIIGIIAVIRTWVIHTGSSKQFIFMWSGILIIWVGRLMSKFF